MVDLIFVPTSVMMKESCDSHFSHLFWAPNLDCHFPEVFLKMFAWVSDFEFNFGNQFFITVDSFVVKLSCKLKTPLGTLDSIQKFLDSHDSISHISLKQLLIYFFVA